MTGEAGQVNAHRGGLRTGRSTIRPNDIVLWAAEAAGPLRFAIGLRAARAGCAPLGQGREIAVLLPIVDRVTFNGHIIETSASPNARAEPPGDTICSWTLTFRRRSGIQPPWPMAVPRLGLEIQLHVGPVSRQGAGGVCSQVFEVIADTPQHTYQVLTKRSTRLRRLAGELDWPANL